MITLTINGSPHEVDVPADTPLLWVLRDTLQLTGTKYGCGQALCGACMVLIDGKATPSCATPVEAAQGQNIQTIEGVSGKVADAVRASWQKLNVVQCGYCQSGQIVAAISLLSENAKPSDADIDSVMSRNVCRCATYVRVRAAIHDAAKTMEG
jgi:isoquinoline 1-oxidoreductase alpha subunit